MTGDDEPPATVADAQSRITAFWDTVSGAYDDERGNVPRRDSREESAWVDALAAMLPAPPASVLDVGTGTGFAAVTAASLGHRVTGIDLSERMLELARRRARDGHHEVDFVRGDAVAPRFAAGNFDAVVNRSLLWTLLRLDSALAAWRALLRPGGRLICVYGLVDAPPEGTSPLRPASRSRGAFFDAHYTPETQALLAGMGLRDHQPLLDAVAAAGFQSAEVRTLEISDPAEGAPLPTHYGLVAIA